MQIRLAENDLTINATDCRPTEGGWLVSASLLTLDLPAAPVRYLYSGWQSWSLTAWVDIHRPVRPIRPRIFHPMQTDPQYAREQRPHGSWYGAVELPGGQVIFVGSLALDSHVLLNGSTLNGWVEAGKGEWFIAAGDEALIFERYADLLAERYGRGKAAHPYRVWCSWYSLYTEIREETLLKVLGDLGDLPFDVFQVDDGWQAAIGDWEPNDKFPAGMDSLAARIQATGRKAGLWLAPLLVTPSSALFRAHPDWLLHDETGQPVSAGFNWGEQLFALDTTHPEALQWLAQLMKKVRRWGYDYLKLDFLYAGALPGKRYQDMPREAAYRHGLQVIREALGDAYFLTCGAPILPSIGLCDALRIGPDVSGDWSSKRDEDLLMNFTTPGTRNALRTCLHRLWLAPLLHTDPDVVYFRTRQVNLDAGQRVLLQDMANLCNFKATSDIPAWLSTEEKDDLRTFLARTPVVRRQGRYLFEIGDRSVDFTPHISLPPDPGPIHRLVGALLDGLTRIKSLFRAFKSRIRNIPV